MPRPAVFAASVFVATLLASRSHAQDAPEPLNIDYEAPAGCPSRTAFAGEIFARTSKAREATASERARVLHVRVERRGEAHAGRLWIDQGGAREVTGGSCAEVVGALGLVAALAVDPQASVAPRPAPPVSTESTTPAKEEPRPSVEQEKEREREREKEREREREREREARPPPREGERTRFAMGAGAEAAAIADVVFAGRLFAQLDFKGDLFAPSVRLAIARSLDVERSPSVGSASLTWTHAALDLCPLRIDLASTLSARPCATFGAGVLQAEGSGVADARSRSRPWVQAGAHGRLVWVVVRPVALEVEGGAVVPLLRESFFFEPTVPIYEAPPIAGVLRAAVVVRFP